MTHDNTWRGLNPRLHYFTPRARGILDTLSEILDNVERWLKDAQQIPLEEHPLSTGNSDAKLPRCPGYFARLLSRWTSMR
jgi:hypothetical protein